MVKNLPVNAGDLGSPGEGSVNPLQYSCLGNPQTEEPGGLQSMGPQRVEHEGDSEHTRLKYYMVNAKEERGLPGLLMWGSCFTSSVGQQKHGLSAKISMFK